MHRSALRHLWKFNLKFGHRTKLKKHRKWLMRPLVSTVRQVQAVRENIACRPHAYRCVGNAPQNFQTFRNANVWKERPKLIFRCFNSNKYFKRTLLACFQMFYSLISPLNWKIQFRLFMLIAVATIHSHVYTLFRLAETACDVCFSKLQKYSKKRWLPQAHKNMKLTKWQ